MSVDVQIPPEENEDDNGDSIVSAARRRLRLMGVLGGRSTSDDHSTDLTRYENSYVGPLSLWMLFLPVGGLVHVF